MWWQFGVSKWKFFAETWLCWNKIVGNKRIVSSLSPSTTTLSTTKFRLKTGTVIDERYWVHLFLIYEVGTSLNSLLLLGNKPRYSTVKSLLIHLLYFLCLLLQTFSWSFNWLLCIWSNDLCVCMWTCFHWICLAVA